MAVGPATGMGVQSLLDALLGKKEEVPTRLGPTSVRRGGLSGQLASLAGGTANLPLVGPVISSDAPAVSEESAIHEAKGHEEGRGALYDLIQSLRGYGTPEGAAPAYWRPSEVYAYTTQPAELSGNELSGYGADMLRRPELIEYFERHRNPQSDWPSPAALRVGKSEMLQRALATRKQP